MKSRKVGYTNIFLLALLIESLSLFTDASVPLEEDAPTPSAMRVPVKRPAKRPAEKPAERPARAVKNVLEKPLNTVEAPKKRRWCRRSTGSAATIVIAGVQLRIEVGEIEPRNIKVEPL